ncbi:hypothetical protein B0I72DRAFT_139906 [Yarrowia lipolytica]|uniref:YALI0E00682p n=2 Tax=Yarrowia lipolytica TaxID=4952 RepID=Q6C7I0_YARLI|nr:YALI0E00682p [Yarrowia lipolytica CLIB122]AOW04771.1 hypothetical protein YALI1_E01057g [Yarrowia lipolytica]KAB8282825.1 hypothetical protein BKA91DRAFT_137768 [Yarrowia lipolytica]KAE8174548.1 hypothetical protein BKA90DRAFT_133611 [Yarrowia lipolytica]KAJ8056354.1 hypothetical protein LXG23DRAFT_16879 [Yarrowia lipolytica]QNQ00438.1 Hypothetical protein YALI2_E01753g [Yarrowia lipolytica]|eukprot:XP_503382.1 YALI0E00682p [Yarrowia lipolytica CLIB122]
MQLDYASDEETLVTVCHKLAPVTTLNQVFLFMTGPHVGTYALLSLWIGLDNHNIGMFLGLYVMGQIIIRLPYMIPPKPLQTPRHLNALLVRYLLSIISVILTTSAIVRMDYIDPYMRFGVLTLTRLYIGYVGSRLQLLPAFALCTWMTPEMIQHRQVWKKIVPANTYENHLAGAAILTLIWFKGKHLWPLALASEIIEVCTLGWRCFNISVDQPIQTSDLTFNDLDLNVVAKIGCDNSKKGQAEYKRRMGFVTLFEE